MKNKIKYIALFICVLMVGINVYAVDLSDARSVVKENGYKTMELVPVENSINISGDNLDYTNINYNNVTSELSIGSITNTTNKKIPISISIGFFDLSQKNVGIFNYCSDNDIETNYSGLQLTSKNSTSFSFIIDDEYLKDKINTTDIKYIAVMSDNKDCKVGGADSYLNKTIDQIEKKDSVDADKYDGFLTLEQIIAQFTFVFIIFIVLSLVLYIVQGFVLNNLHTRMYGNGTGLCWVPVCNSYITVKLAFGKPIAFIYILVTILSAVFGVVFMTAICSLVVFGAFILDIVKLITRNYNLCIVENLSLPSSMKKDSNNSQINDSIDYENRDNSLINNDSNNLINDDFNNVNSSNDNDNAFMPQNANDVVSSGGFSNDNTFGNDNFSDSTESNDDVINKLVNFSDGTNSDTNKSSGNNSSNNDNGGNDLTNFFR